MFYPAFQPSQNWMSAMISLMGFALMGVLVARMVRGLLADEIRAAPSLLHQPQNGQLRRKSLEILDRLITQKRNDPNWEKWPHGTPSDARKAVYKEMLEGFNTLTEAREYVEGMPEDNVIFTARGDEIPFLLIKLIIADIERTPWLSPFRPERLEISWQPPLMPQANPELLPATSIPREELRRIAGEYGWWAARQAEALCPYNDVACVEREAKRLYEVVKHRRGGVSW